MSRATRLIVGWAVVDHRDKASLQPMVTALPTASVYYRDGMPTYAQLRWPEGGRHEVSVGKRNTYTVEGMNAQLRQLCRAAATQDERLC